MNLRTVAHRVLARLGLEVRRPPRPLMGHADARLSVDLDHLVAQLIVRDPDVFLVQIGAFDGTTGDQVHDYVLQHGWRGILVEPQRRYFEDLGRAYADVPGIELRNVAISHRREVRTLWATRADAKDLPDWAPQTATFDRARLEKAGLGGVIEPQQVECITMQELLDGVDRVDFLQVDTEGFDAEIIALFPFETYKPAIVRFENVCLSREDHARAVRRLVDQGYRVAQVGPDTIASRRPQGVGHSETAPSSTTA